MRQGSIILLLLPNPLPPSLRGGKINHFRKENSKFIRKGREKGRKRWKGKKKGKNGREKGKKKENNRKKGGKGSKK